MLQKGLLLKNIRIKSSQIWVSSPRVTFSKPVSLSWLLWIFILISFIRNIPTQTSILQAPVSKIKWAIGSIFRHSTNVKNATELIFTQEKNSWEKPRWSVVDENAVSKYRINALTVAVCLTAVYSDFFHRLRMTDLFETFGKVQVSGPSRGFVVNFWVPFLKILI